MEPFRVARRERRVAQLLRLDVRADRELRLQREDFVRLPFRFLDTAELAVGCGEHDVRLMESGIALHRLLEPLRGLLVLPEKVEDPALYLEHNVGIARIEPLRLLDRGCCAVEIADE